jgi:hypothetical protein
VGLSEETEKAAHGTFLEILTSVVSEMPEEDAVDGDDDGSDDDTPLTRAVDAFCDIPRRIVASTIDQLYEIAGDFLADLTMDEDDGDEADGAPEVNVPDDES